MSMERIIEYKCIEQITEIPFTFQIRGTFSHEEEARKYLTFLPSGGTYMIMPMYAFPKEKDIEQIHKKHVDSLNRFKQQILLYTQLQLNK